MGMEIQIGFGGQNVQFPGYAQSRLLTVFSYSRNLCQQLRADLVGARMPESEAAASANYPLLQQDLVQLSLDWKVDIPDFVSASGVQLSSKFHST